MKYTIPCEVVQDLLPSYVEDLTSPATNEYVKEHLEACEACNEIYENMKPEEVDYREYPQAKEIDYLKQVRKKHSRSLIGAFALFFVVGFIWALVSPYILGKSMSLETINYNIDVDGNHLDLLAVPVEDGKAISNVKVEEVEAGVLEISFTGVKAKPWAAGNALEVANGVSYDASQDISQILCDGVIIWYGDQTISRITSEVYESRHLYLGNMADNGETVNALNLVNYLGNFTNELETSKTPYSWTLKMETSYSSLRRNQLETRMRGYAYAMIAVIDNLDIVRFTYNIDDQEACVLAVTKKEASQFLGHDIKEAGKDPGLLQELMEKSGLTEEHYFTEDNGSDKAAENTIALNLINMTEEELGSVGISFYIEEGGQQKLVSTMSGMNANESKIKAGEYVKYVLAPEDFGLKTFGDESLSIGIRVTDEIPVSGGTYETYEVENQISLSAETVETVMIEGSYKTGFKAQTK